MSWNTADLFANTMVMEKSLNKPFTNLLITIHYFTLSSSSKMRIMTNIFGPHRPILPCIVLGADWLLNDSVWHMYNKSK